MRRWLYYVSLIFIYGLPMVLIVEKTTKIKNTDKWMAVSLVGMIFGITYLVFLSKKVKEAISKMSISVMQVFLTNIIMTIPFITVGLVCHIIERALVDAMPTAISIAACIAVGSLLRALEYQMNKKYMYELEITKIAQKQLDIEKKLKRLREEKEEKTI